jgi:hypothetical protein
MDASGASAAPGGGAMSRGANLGAGGHLDADTIDLAELEAHSKVGEGGSVCVCVYARVCTCMYASDRGHH